MARNVQTVTTVTDDLTGKPLADEKAVNVRFTVNGRRYAVDTDAKGETLVRETEAKAQEAYAAVMAELVSKAQPVTAGKSANLSAMREWAKANAPERGWTIGDKGRLPAEVHTAYAAAQG